MDRRPPRWERALWLRGRRLASGLGLRPAPWSSVPSAATRGRAERSVRRGHFLGWRACPGAQGGEGRARHGGRRETRRTAVPRRPRTQQRARRRAARGSAVGPAVAAASAVDSTAGVLGRFLRAMRTFLAWSGQKRWDSGARPGRWSVTTSVPTDPQPWGHSQRMVRAVPAVPLSGFIGPSGGAVAPRCRCPKRAARWSCRPPRANVMPRRSRSFSGSVEAKTSCTTRPVRGESSCQRWS